MLKLEHIKKSYDDTVVLDDITILIWKFRKVRLFLSWGLLDVEKPHY